MSDTLRDLVADLTRVQKHRIEIAPGHAITAKTPCLLAQLAEGIETGGTPSGTRGIAASRPPLNAAALDLWVDITTNTHGWADILHIDRRGYAASPAASQGLSLPPIGALLRAVAAEAIGRAEENIIDATERGCRRWIRGITNLFTPGGAGQRHIYGATCPNCGETAITTIDNDGERVRVPAIVVNPDPDPDRPLRWATCQACGYTRGIPLYETEVAA